MVEAFPAAGAVGATTLHAQLTHSHDVAGAGMVNPGSQLTHSVLNVWPGATTQPLPLHTVQSDRLTFFVSGTGAGPDCSCA